MTTCPICGSDHVQKRGFSESKAGRNQKYYCLDHDGFFNEADTPEDFFPAVLIFDVETLPLLCYTWGVYDQNINMEQVVKDWCILSWSAKWLNDERIISDVLTPKEAVGRNDKRLVGGMWRLLDEADVLIGHNCRRFDIRKLNSRFLVNNIPPPSSYRAIDTLVASRTAFGMTFNRLDYLAQYLKLPRKIETKFKLWRDCDLGDKEALAKIREYNERDVLVLESVYAKIKPWIPGHPRFTAYEKVKDVCIICFAPIEKIGYYQAPIKKYPEFRCTSCQVVFHSTRPVKD